MLIEPHHVRTVWKPLFPRLKRELPHGDGALPDMGERGAYTDQGLNISIQPRRWGMRSPL